MSKSIVTGGCGFIGSHLVKRLISLDHEVIVLDRVKPNNPCEGATYYLQDISENYSKYIHLFDSVNNVFFPELVLNSLVSNMLVSWVLWRS